MTGKTHQLLGLTCGTWWYLLNTAPLYHPATFAGVIVGTHLSALVPDIDTQAAQIWQQIPGGKIVGKIASVALEHRNISHSILGMAIFGWLLHWLVAAFPSYWGIDTSTVTIACLIAYGSHLLADAITVEGIPLLFPYQYMFGFPPYPFNGMRIVSGKWFENLLIFPLLVIGFWLILWFKWPVISQIIFI